MSERKQVRTTRLRTLRGADKVLKRGRPKKKREDISYQDGGEGFCKFVEDFVCFKIFPIGDPFPKWVEVRNLPDTPHPETKRSYYEMWLKEKEVLVKALEMDDNGIFLHRVIVLCWMRGEGKCQVKGSKVIMWDGSLRKVEDVKVGDFLMGDDSTPRKVLSLASGKEEMFEVVPYRGTPKTFTKDHVLSLKNSSGNVTDISIKDYLLKNKSFKRSHYLYHVPVEFEDKEVSISPYFLGLWLGDGSKHATHITTPDPEIVSYLKEYADLLGLRVTERVKDKGENKAKTYCIVGSTRGEHHNNELLWRMKDYDLINNKHIPHEYKCNSREKRLELLAGIIDSDGYLNRNSFQITQKSKTLTDDIAFLARSLGFFVNVSKCTKGIKETGFSGEYYTIGISGDCSIIPCKVERKKASVRNHKKDVLTTGIKEIKSAGVQEYYGFELDGNHRYVLEDFTVTHNSFLACLIQLWKFFCFPDQQIVLGANSKDQSKFVHFDIICEIIRNSPKLLSVIREENIQQKEIRLINSKGTVVSAIKSISSFSGIVSNITGYTFSEIFDMKNPKFFTQLDGSTRNVPNALGVIDSTVSEKTHILYKLYQAYKQVLDPTLFFSYRASSNADARDFWHPYMTQAQLDSYKTKFLPADYDRYFKNTWESGSNNIFSEAMIRCCEFIGFDGKIGMQKTLLKLFRDEQKIINKPSLRTVPEFSDIEARKKSCMPITKIYSFEDERGLPKMIEANELSRLSDYYDTDFALGIGIDRADPLKDDLTRGARTIVLAILKGLVGSRTNLAIDNKAEQEYIYFCAGAWHIRGNDLNSIKAVLDEIVLELGSIESVCGERWGLWDLVDWCDDNGVVFNAVNPSYDLQKTAFSELYTLIYEGRYKAPKIPIQGTKSEYLFEEEALKFVHDSKKRFYGSPEKHDNMGVQDDSMFALGWGIYGLRLLGIDDFTKRSFSRFMGAFFEDKTNRRIII
jgi:hypothetical protein